MSASIQGESTPILDGERQRHDWHPALRRLYDYWRAITPTTVAFPARRDFDPMAVVDLLPWIWLIDIQREPLRFRYRLLGSRHYEAMTGDFTGKWMDEAHSGFLTSPVYKDYVQLALHGQGSWRRGRPNFRTQREQVLTLERILLPLAADGRKPDMILAITVFIRADGSMF